MANAKDALREQGHAAVISLLNNRRDKSYRAGVLQLAVLIGLITKVEWSRLFHAVRCGQKVFTRENLCEPS